MDHLDKASTTNQQISKSKCAHMHAKLYFSYLLSAYFSSIISSVVNSELFYDGDMRKMSMERFKPNQPYFELKEYTAADNSIQPLINKLYDEESGYTIPVYTGLKVYNYQDKNAHVTVTMAGH
ncbi:MAG: hypothetical protein AAF600_21510 [Bacteroidota bacterium]